MVEVKVLTKVKKKSVSLAVKKNKMLQAQFSSLCSLTPLKG